MVISLIHDGTFHELLQSNALPIQYKSNTLHSIYKSEWNYVETAVYIVMYEVFNLKYSALGITRKFTPHLAQMLRISYDTATVTNRQLL